MPETVAAWAAQFGLAGLVCWMWLSERRAAAQRERELREAHDRLMRERRGSDVLMAALNDNTRALASLEACQRGLTEALVGVVGGAVRGGVTRGGGV